MAGGDPDFGELSAKYGGSVAPTASTSLDDPVFNFPKEYENVFVLLSRGEPIRMQAPGAAGRRIGGDLDTQLGPTFAGGGGQQISLAKLLRDYYRVDSKSLGEYQQALWLGGFYTGKTAPVFGIADERGFAAFQKAALRAARSKKTLMEVLQEAIGAGAGEAAQGGGRERAPLSIRLTNPADIARVAEAAAREVLGEAATPQQVQAIVKRYQGAESSYQRNAYGDAYSGGTSVAPPSLEAFALDALEADDPLKAEAYAVADDVAQTLEELLGGPFGGE